jgi:hypothetical protein
MIVRSDLSHSVKDICRHIQKVFKNTVLRKTFGPERDEVTAKCRRPYNEKLYALYSSPNIIWVIKVRSMR